jgi:hypothetical protein
MAIELSRDSFVTSGSGRMRRQGRDAARLYVTPSADLDQPALERG